MLLILKSILRTQFTQGRRERGVAALAPGLPQRRPGVAGGRAPPFPRPDVFLPYGGDEAGGEGVVRKAQQQAALAHTCVAAARVSTPSTRRQLSRAHRTGEGNRGAQIPRNPVSIEATALAEVGAAEKGGDQHQGPETSRAPRPGAGPSGAGTHRCRQSAAG